MSECSGHSVYYPMCIILNVCNVHSLTTTRACTHSFTVQVAADGGLDLLSSPYVLSETHVCIACLCVCMSSHACTNARCIHHTHKLHMHSRAHTHPRCLWARECGDCFGVEWLEHVGACSEVAWVEWSGVYCASRYTYCGCTTLRVAINACEPKQSLSTHSRKRTSAARVYTEYYPAPTHPHTQLDGWGGGWFVGGAAACVAKLIIVFSLSVWCIIILVAWGALCVCERGQYT